MRNGSGLAAFLHYGFLPRVPQGLEELTWARESAYPVMEGISEEEAIDRGIAAFREVTQNLEGERHVIPLSGGLDSRLLLGRLLEEGFRDRIHAVTFGVPGIRAAGRPIYTPTRNGGTATKCSVGSPISHGAAGASA